MLNLRLVKRNHCGLRIFGAMVIALFGFMLQAHSQCTNPANPIVAENCLTGNSSDEWDIQAADAGDLTIQGFSTDISVNQGGTINFKINTDASSYSINIYRMGYYGGAGARKVATITPSAHLPQTQPPCKTVDATGVDATGITDCGTWAVSASWQVPATATSGIYFAHLVRGDSSHGDSHIVFVVRNDASTSKILFQTSDPTWQAYNYYGNGSLYGPGVPNFDLPNRVFAASYNRPVLTRGFESESNTFVFGAEFPMVQWLEANGYDVSYSTGVDAARNGALIKNHKVYMDCGHDEYVSAPARANIEAARDAGVNLAFFSGNEVFWKTRWENSIDGSNTPYRSLICYKETLAFGKLDPLDPPTWTGTWRDPSFSPPGDGGKPENALTGTLFMVNGTGVDNPGNLTIKVPSDDGKMRFWRNTAAATLAQGASYTLVPGSLGYEWDVDADNGFRPAGAFRLSTSTYNLTADLLLDYGGTYGAGPATHHMMTYRAPSGALVFGAGTINWSWGLNSNHDNPFDFPNPDPDINMEQATVNLFADMGVQPATIQPGLRTATASTDVIPPHSQILSPAVGATVNTGNTVTVSGTASDTAGVVAGVEVSGDGGATWHPATGRATWTYTWTPSATGSTTLLSRAVDDSGNIETPSSGVIVGVSPQTCPCTIFGTSNSPTSADSGDTNAIEVGVKFRADADGSILGVRFFKSAANTGTHIGHVWSSTGQLLGTATFSAETASGWQQVNFSTPIPAVANTTYVASYLAPTGHYSADSFYFEQSGHDDPPLHALANGVDGSDGVYLYGASGGFPTSTFNATNYWVDVIYASSNTYSISGTISGNGGAGAVVVLSGPENLSTNADASGNFVFDGVVNGNYNVSVSNPGVSFAPPSQGVTVNFSVVTGVNFVATVTNPLTISGTISGGAGASVFLAGAATATATADSSGNYVFNGLLSGSYTVTPSEPTFIFIPSTQSVTLSGSSATNVNFQGQVCTCISIFQPSDTPALIDSGDANSVELGVKFKADSPAALTGIRFYKAAANVGTHVGHLWSESGTLLATATFPGETASGWQQGYFTSPVQLSANTTYVASYFAPSGHYSASTNYFASSGVDRPPLHALADGVDGGNGVFFYTTTGGFPSGSFEASNYWVDVLYAAQPHNISGTITGAGGAGATVTLSGTSQATTTADALGNYTFAGVFSGTYSVTPGKTGYVFVPGIQTVAVSTADVTGVNFTVPAQCPCNTVWQSTAQPTSIDGGDPQAIEVGTKIRADSDGYVLGVRFYKASANTGQHIGNLWSASGANAGTLLASANSTSESTSGWQQVIFTKPVPVTANTTYVASYFVPNGHYSGDSEFFSGTGVDSPPLHALQDGVDGSNGVFNYGSASAYPASTFGAANYWVDLIYAKSLTHSIGGTISGAGGPNVTVVLSGSSSATTIADVNGNYAFDGLADGTYTITPGGTGYIVTPTTQTITLNGAHNLGVNFNATIPTFVVSGTVAGAPGIPMTLTGPTSQTTVADSSGNYSFASVPNGTYTVTPSNVGFAVTPSSQSVTVNGAAVTNVNFSGNVILYSISGTITGGAGATINLSGTAPATTTADSSGNYSFTSLTVGTYTITPSLGSGVLFNPGNLTVVLSGANVTGANFAVLPNCPCDTIFPANAVPTEVDFGDATPTELGVKFRVDADAYIAGVRFYKGFANTGTHLGRIWTSSGTLLGTATFVNESSSGWQQVLFSSPIAVAANTTYVASYFAPVGHYPADVGYFLNAGVDAPPVHALGSGVDGPNGVFSTVAGGGFPNLSFNNNASNYWVDVIYTPSSTYSISGSVTGTGGPGTTVSLSGASTATTTADSLGNFTFYGLGNGSYVVTPSESGFTYTPATLSATINSAHSLGLSFSSSTANAGITGLISGAGGPGATVTVTGPASATTTADGTGAFSFPGLNNGSYTVAVSKAGFSFNPPSQVVTLNGVNANVNFTSVAQTFTITGTISGAGGNGATVNLTGVTTATTIASASGLYTFSGLASGNYTVAVSKTGFTFTPTSQPVTVSGANATANFTSAVQSFNITGTLNGVGASGATVKLTGAATATTTASSTGVYTFSGLVNGSYTVTPSKTGVTFTPSSQSVSVNGADVTANFTSVVTNPRSITGTISGAGGASATVTLSGAATATVSANTSGSYTISGLPPGSYTVTPSKVGYTFTPASQTVTISTTNVTANFSSTALTFSISGTIAGTGGNGATVRLSGAKALTTTASASGAYSFTGLANGTYTVAASKTGFTFTPSSQSVTLSGASATVNFTSTAQTFTISGTISGTGGNGATVNLTGASTAATTASASGAYSFTGVTAGSYTITPSKAGFTFTPPSQTVTVSTANVTANFSSAVQTFSITGTISGTGGSGATVTLSGAKALTVTANTSGVYSFTGLANGAYTVTPSKTGFTYTPTSQSVTVNGANATANFTSTVHTFSITGTISGTGGNGATVRITGTATATTTANASGSYTFTGVTVGSYTVTPTKAGFTFTPSSQAVTVSTANVTANFSSVVQTFSITGTLSGTGGNGATVTLGGAKSQTVTASSSGAYSFTGLANGTYTVTPSKSGFTFNPLNRSITVNGANTTANFTATQSFSITGTISGAGGSGATVALSGSATANVTANTSGVYTFTGLANGIYTVKPTKTGRTFTPGSQSTIVIGANVTGLNFSSR